MKAAKWYGKKDIRIEEIPAPPAPGPGEAQIKVAWCGICGSDLHEYLAGPIFIPVEPHPLTGAKAPLVLGHEFSGEVVAVGEGVQTVQVGDVVAPDACQHCGVCVNCREGRYNVCEKLAFTGLMADGAFAEYVNVPAELCYVLPDDFDLEAASLIEPLATGFKAVRMAGSLLGPGRRDSGRRNHWPGDHHVRQSRRRGSVDRGGDRSGQKRAGQRMRG